MVDLSVIPARVRRNRLLRWAVGRRNVVFAVWSVLLALVHLFGPVAVSWHSFVTGSDVLTSAKALHLFALHPDLQIGPATYAVVIPVVTLTHGPAGQVLAVILCSAAGLLLMRQIEWLAPKASKSLVLGAGLLLLVIWSEVAVLYAHPDDIAALLCALAALHLARSGHVVWAGVLIGLATDCKPWALAFLPIVMIGTRRRVLAVIACLVTVVAAWLPFYLADSGSIAAARFTIGNVSTSSLRVFGIDAARTPSWDRPAQLVLGAGLALLAVRKGRWPAIVLLAVCARLLLDPSTKSYYDAGLAIGAVLVDLLMVGGVVPIVTASVLFVFSATRIFQHLDAPLYGFIRTVFLLAAIALVFVIPTDSAREVDWLRRRRFGGPALARDRSVVPESG